MPWQSPYAPGMYGDFTIEQVNQLIQQGHTLPHPESGEPVIAVTPEGRPLTASMAAGLAAMGPISLTGSTQIDPDAAIRGLEQTQPGPDYGTQRPEVDAINQRFGTDMSWLDPMFQRPTVTTQDALQFGTTADPSIQAAQASLAQNIAGRGVSADPSVVAQQNGLLAGLQDRGLTANPEAQNLQMGLAQQLATRGTTADYQSEQGLRSLVGNLQGEGSAANSGDETVQRNLLADIQTRGPSANAQSRDQQNSLLQGILGRGTTSDTQSEAAQRAAMNELFGLYRQGGQDAQNRAARAQARSTSENWLRGQREADMASLSERGVSGSGAELTTLLGDRQAAAQRLSAADLEADAAAERRALEALLGGVGIASQMRGQADAYTNQNTAAASGLASNIRSADDAFRNQGDAMAAQLSTAIRNAGDAYTQGNNRMIGDVLAGLQGRADSFANTGAQLQSGILNNVQTANDAYANFGVQQQNSLLQGMRSAADQYSLGNTAQLSSLLGGMRNSADSYVQNNANMIAQASGANAAFLQNAYQQMLNSRNQWDLATLGQQINVAGGLQGGARQDNNSGFGTQVGIATTDTGRGTGAVNNQNQNILSQWQLGTQGVNQANQGVVKTAGQSTAALGQAIQGGLQFGGALAGYGGL